MGKKIISIFMLILVISILCVSSVSAIIEHEPDFEVKSFWDNFKDLFTGRTFSTSGNFGRKEVKYNDYIDVDFSFYCKEASSDNYFSFALKEVDKNTIIKPNNWFRKTSGLGVSCSDKQTQRIGVDNLKIPDLLDSQCGKILNVMVKHEREIYGQYTVDTYGSDSIDGYEKIGSIQYICEEDICDGKEGEWVNDELYCDGNDVVRDIYTGIVRGDSCLDTIKVLENCGSIGCKDGACKKPTVTRYIYNSDDNICESIVVDQDESSNYYQNKENCEDENIIPTQDEEQDEYQDEEVEEEDDVIDNSEDNKEDETTSEDNDESNNKFISFFINLWNKFLDLFR